MRAFFGCFVWVFVFDFLGADVRLVGVLGIMSTSSRRRGILARRSSISFRRSSHQTPPNDRRCTRSSTIHSSSKAPSPRSCRRAHTTGPRTSGASRSARARRTTATSGAPPGSTRTMRPKPAISPFLPPYPPLLPPTRANANVRLNPNPTWVMGDNREGEGER